MKKFDVAKRTTLRDAARGCAGRHTLGGLDGAFWPGRDLSAARIAGGMSPDGRLCKISVFTGLACLCAALIRKFRRK